MKIDELIDSEKSVMIAKLCGWAIVKEETESWGPEYLIKDTNGNVFDGSVFNQESQKWTFPDLYHIKNFALAWRVLNWVWESPIWHSYAIWKIERMGRSFETMSPDQAQRRWLDKILELAIEEGLV